MKKQIFLITFFASICTPIKNSSLLPLLPYRTNARITSFDITDDDISLIIKNLDPAKAHGSDNISIKMTKICSESLTVPLKMIFEQSLKEGRFPAIWKKINAVPVYKKEDNNLLDNYRPISLLPIFNHSDYFPFSTIA